MTKVTRWLVFAFVLGIVLGSWLALPGPVSAQAVAVCDPTTTCFDVSLPSGLTGDFYLGDTLIVSGVNSARLAGTPATPLVISVRSIQEPGVVGFADLYIYPDQSQANVQGFAGQTRLLFIRPIKNYVKGILSYTCSPRGFKPTDSVACRPTIDGTAMADIAPGAVATYNLAPGAHTVHTDLVGDAASNWSTVARDDAVTVNAGTAFPQTTRLSADFILKSLLQISLAPANLVADVYVDGTQVVTQTNAFNIYVAANVAHTVEAKNLQEPGGAGFGDLYNYADQSQANVLAGPAQTRVIIFRPAKNYLKGVLSYTCNPRGFKPTDSVACRPTIDGTAMADIAPGAVATYNLAPGAHTVHTDLVGDAASNWSTVARDDAVTVNAGTAFPQTTRLSADFILKSLLQISLAPANLVADVYVDGTQVVTQTNAFNIYVAANVAHTVEAKNLQEPGGAGFGDLYNYADQSQANVLAGPAQIRAVIFRPAKNYVKGVLSYICDPSGFKPTDSVACRPTIDGAVVADVAPGATVAYNLAPGAHTVHTELVGDSVNNWSPIIRDDAPTVNAGTSFLQTTVLRATFQLKALLKITLYPAGIVADFFVNDAQAGSQVPAADVYVAAGAYNVQVKNVTDTAANGVYRYDDASTSVSVFANQTRPIQLMPKKVFLQGYLNVTCRINGTLPGDDVRCSVAADAQPIGTVEAGQTQKFTLATGAHAINVRLAGRNAALWSPTSVDNTVNVIGGGTAALVLSFDAKGRQLMAQGMFQEAMAFYQSVRAASQDPEVLAGADQGYQEALMALANAPTGQGAAVIQRAFASACAGQPGGSPAINLFKDRQGKSLVCNGSFGLPPDLTATVPGYFRYAIVKETGTDEVERCPYRGTSGVSMTLVRVESWLRLKLINVESGQVVNENTFRGSSAPGCPSSRWFRSYTEYTYGGQPSLDDAINWLRGVW